MSTISDAVEKARNEAQALHKQLSSSTEKNHAAIRANARSVAAEASQLAGAVTGLIASQQSDAKQHLKDAAATLQAAASDAQSVVTAGDDNLKERNTVALGRIRSATQKLSQAVAAKRASLVKS